MHIPTWVLVMFDIISALAFVFLAPSAPDDENRL